MCLVANGVQLISSITVVFYYRESLTPKTFPRLSHRKGEPHGPNFRQSSKERPGRAGETVGSNSGTIAGFSSITLSELKDNDERAAYIHT